MHSSIWIASVLATLALAAPSYAPAAGDNEALSQYFQLLAEKVKDRQDSTAPAKCDLTLATMPQSSLPQPNGLTLKHVAIGRGTQNYTCVANDATAIPKAAGAVATLYNASCIAATNPDFLATIPNFALQLDPSNAEVQGQFAPANLDISGLHFFTDTTTPFFTLDTKKTQLGAASCSKNASAPAPAGAPLGQGNQGFGSVAWLQLLTKSGATGQLAEVYRMNTAGGNPPPNCGSSPAKFQVQYAAEYWFWET